MRTEATEAYPRLLHVFDRYELLTKGGGVERYIHFLAAKSSENYTVTVMAGWADAPERYLHYKVKAGNYFALWREIGRSAIVHIHGPRSLYAAVAGIFAILQRRRLFYTVHCFYSGKTRRAVLKKKIWDALVERFLFRYAYAVITLSSYWQKYTVAMHLNAHRAVNLPNGVEVKVLAHEQVTPIPLAGSPAILSVSRLDPIKRIEDVIQALRKPGLEQAHLHIVGHGPDEVRLVDETKRLGVEARVTFHHFKNDDEVAAMARGADVFVIASAEEGMPTTILEMLSRGLPVVASAIPGNLSILNLLQDASFYPMGDIETLATQIQHAASTPLEKNMHALLMKYFDWDTIMRSLFTLYQGEK